MHIICSKAIYLNIKVGKFKKLEIISLKSNILISKTAKSRFITKTSIGRYNTMELNSATKRDIWVEYSISGILINITCHREFTFVRIKDALTFRKSKIESIIISISFIHIEKSKKYPNCPLASLNEPLQTFTITFSFHHPQNP